MNQEPCWTGSGVELLEALTAVAVAARKPKSTYTGDALTAVHLEVVDHLDHGVPVGCLLRLVAADGHRLHIAEVPGTGVLSTPKGIRPGNVMPIATLRDLAAASSVTITDHPDKGWVLGEFPAYHEIGADPSDSVWSRRPDFVVEAKAALAALKTFGRKSTKPVVVTVELDFVVFERQGDDAIRHEIPAVVNATERAVWGVNPVYLLEAIKAVAPGRGARATITYPGHELDPLGVAGAGRSRAIVMPMRLD